MGTDLLGGKFHFSFLLLLLLYCCCGLSLLALLLIIFLSLQEVKKRMADGEKVTQPVLEHFQWHRLILDEGHEFIDETCLHRGKESSEEKEIDCCFAHTPFQHLQMYKPTTTGTSLALLCRPGIIMLM